MPTEPTGETQSPNKGEDRSVSKKREELKRQLAECAAELRQQEGAKEAGKKNVKDVCDGLIAMNHYFHILLLMLCLNQLLHLMMFYQV